MSNTCAACDFTPVRKTAGNFRADSRCNRLVINGGAQRVIKSSTAIDEQRTKEGLDHTAQYWTRTSRLPVDL